MQKNFNTLGVMIDCSRNAVMNLPELKNYITLLAKMGYNQVQLYMEDTYEIENEEFFGYRRGKYSMDELKEIVDFADGLGIEMVPCMQTLAHLNCIFRWKKYREMLDMDDILMVGDPKVYEFIDNMFTSLKKCFKSDKIHIGMDEAHNLGKGKYRDKNGERDRAEILLEHLNKVCEIADKHGLKPMMWSDMFYRLANGGEYYTKANTEFSDEIKSKIPKNVTLVYWDYYHLEKGFYDKMIKGHKQLTEKVAFGGGAWKWSGFVPHNELGVIATKSALTACVENGIKDTFITMWGDNGGETSPYSVLPALCVAACVNIGIFDDDEIKAKFKEWTGADFDAFMMLGLPDYIEGCKADYVANPSKYQFYNDCLLGLYDEGGVYEGDGKNYAEISAKLKNAKENAGDYGYLFDTLAALCDVLELKAEIGVRARKAYKDADKEELKNIVADYSDMIDRTEEFYNVFRKQWYRENKPYGFEVQDMRIGGLIMRMKNCCNTIEEYLAGDIDKIVELEEKTLKFIERKELVNLWKDIITANIM